MTMKTWLVQGGLVALSLGLVVACESSSDTAAPGTGGTGTAATGGGGTGGTGGTGGSAGGSGGGGVTDPELITLADFQVEGAFRLPASDFGASSMNYSQGPIEYDAADHSIYIVGHAHQQAIAEFGVPNLVNSTTLADLEIAAAPTQDFVQLLDATTGGNPEAMDRVGGMELVTGASGPELIVNAYEYYDAPGDNTLSTLVSRDAADLAGGTADGYFRYDSRPGHTSGWISPIPTAWQTDLGGTHITGQSSGIPIISRCSVGPSAFAFDPQDMLSAGTDPVATVRLLDFSLDQPLHDDLSNDGLDNDLWTHLSRVTFGFVPPGSRTYVTLGNSGGHESGVCYKCTQDDGNLCGGYCSPAADDNYLYYWLWDLDDLLAVKAGAMEAYAVRPYEYGEFPAMFPTTEIGGGTFDPATGRLYLTLQAADREQGTYSNPPVVVVYSFQPDPGSGARLADLAARGGGALYEPVLRISPIVLVLALAGCSSSSSEEEVVPPVDDSPLGGERPVEPLLPMSFDSTVPTPLVIFLHGFGASGVANDFLIGLSGQVEGRGFILLRPDGTVDQDSKRFWNATDRCCDFYGAGVDDVAYIDGLIAEARGRYSISRVALIGHSNGAYMTHRYACDRAAAVDAFASIAGATWQDASECQPDDTAALLQVNGTEDGSVVYEGEPDGPERPAYPGAVESVERWAGYNGCAPTAVSDADRDYSLDIAGAETLVTRHPDCDPGGAAELWTMVGEGHLPAFNDEWRQAALDFLLGE